MKTLVLLVCLPVLLLVAGCTPTGNASTEIWVRGNCDMCKSTIEEALGSVNGVASANYDLETHLATISYDSNLVRPEAFHQACAGAGYDTKLMPAVAAAYDALPNCCKKIADH